VSADISPNFYRMRWLADQLHQNFACKHFWNCYSRCHEHIKYTAIYEASQAICPKRDRLLLAGLFLRTTRIDRSEINVGGHKLPKKAPIGSQLIGAFFDL